MSCFLEAIDPIFTISKNLLDGSSGFQGAKLFQHVQNVGFPRCCDFRPKQNLKFFVVSWNILNNYTRFKNRNICFWGSWTRPLGPKNMRMRTVLILPKWNGKVTSPTWSRIIIWSFWAALLIKFAIKTAITKAPQTPDLNRPWSGARVGVGMLRGAEDSLTWKYLLFFHLLFWVPKI